MFGTALVLGSHLLYDAISGSSLVWNIEIVSMEVFLKYSAKVATIKADAQYLEGAQAQLKDQSLPLAEILWGEGKNSVVDSEQRDEEQGGARQTPVNTQHTQRRFRRLIKSLNMSTHSNCNALEIRALHNNPAPQERRPL